MNEKKRLDVILFERGFFESREKAQAAVMAGIVGVDGVGAGAFDGHGDTTLKPGMKISPDLDITIYGDALKYVGRGGQKLEKAIELWSIDLGGKVCADIGASTGGFTDVMLSCGASKVYAIDVGYGQLDWKLRKDPRVVNMERTNVRYLDIDAIEDKPSFVSIDVSFISLKLVLPVVSELLLPGGKAVALIKPQFEAGREQVGKGGIVRDEAVRRDTVTAVHGYAENSGLTPVGVTESPITGAKGNVEYLMLMDK
jgi:23S rRNA (cytidine1920-2'-O)/16S rRNA (cytidine1409-2'-O)-methyltransferase